MDGAILKIQEYILCGEYCRGFESVILNLGLERYD